MVTIMRPPQTLSHKGSDENQKLSRKIENNDELRARIEKRLHPLVSPEVVAHEQGIHHQTIYSWIERSRPDLKRKLPYRGKRRRKYGKHRSQKQGWTRLVRSIDEREEAEVSWEGDTMCGKGRARLLTHVERDSLYTQVHLLPDGTAPTVHKTMKHADITGTITYDRGSEFALWKMIESDTKATVYFADAHAPWQRGKNENTNGRLRRVFSKKTDLGTITARQLKDVVRMMNTTPRKSLSWQTPEEMFMKKMRCSSEAN